jgi:hypothetical protein
VKKTATQRIIPSKAEVRGSFQQQLTLLVNMPKRIRSSINSVACRVADLVRSYVPISSFYREVSLSPLLGDLHNWPLLAIDVCPVTSCVYVAGQSTPIFVIDPREEEPKPRWLCGASWPENGLPNLSGGFNSAIITSVKVAQTGIVLFTIDCKSPMLGELPIGQDPRGIYAIKGNQPIRLKFYMQESLTPFRFDSIKAIAVSETKDKLFVLVRNFLYEFEYGEERFDNPDGFHMLRACDVGVRAASITVVSEGRLLLLGEKEIVIVDTSLDKFLIQRMPMKLHLLSLCKMRDAKMDCLLVHSDMHIRAVSNETFLESLKDGRLKTRLQLETTALHRKDILIDLPLLGFDQRKQQIITDTDSRVLTWFDVF